MKSENGGESRVANLHPTTWPNFPESPCAPERGTQRPPRRRGHLGLVGTQAVEGLAELGARLAVPAGSTPDPSPWDYVHASLGFMDVERGAKEGLGGTSGFSEGVRFSPDLVSEL